MDHASWKWMILGGLMITGCRSAPLPQSFVPPFDGPVPVVQTPAVFGAPTYHNEYPTPDFVIPPVSTATMIETYPAGEFQRPIFVEPKMPPPQPIIESP